MLARQRDAESLPRFPEAWASCGWDTRGVLRAVRVFKRATSLGGVGSLIEHRRSMEGPSSPVPDDLLRLSVGIEAAADLVADLGAALDAAGRECPATELAGNASRSRKRCSSPPPGCPVGPRYGRRYRR
jgi:hypothetical protein